MPRSRLANSSLADRLAVQSPGAVLDAILQELESGQLSACNATDIRRIALLLHARLLLFREAERIQSLEAQSDQGPSATPAALEDVDRAVFRLQAQLLAAELRERFPKQQNGAAGITFFAPGTRSNPSTKTIKLKKADQVDLVHVFQDILARIRSRPKS